MSCPGLHCPGCSEGQSLGIAGGVVLGLVLLDQTVQWVTERIWWIGGTVAMCFALAVAAGMWLERWAERRGASFAAAHGIVSRADVIQPGRARAEVLPPREIRHGVAEIRTPGADSGRPAIENHFHIHIGDAAGSDVARALIRTALPGQAGGAITEGNSQP